MESKVQVYSGIRPALKRKILFQGSGKAIVGALMIVIGGAYLPPMVMKYLGLPSLALGALLIAWGLMPYRRLLRLEAQPLALLVEGDTLRYFVGSAPFSATPLSAIERISYCDEDVGRYGIAVDLKEGGRRQVTFQQNKIRAERYFEETQRQYACDLFFPYFTQRSYREIADAVQRSQKFR